jgi:hypothetical protein
VTESVFPLAPDVGPDGPDALRLEVEDLPGVERATVRAGGLHVRFDPDVVSDEEILATLAHHGYAAPGQAPA